MNSEFLGERRRIYTWDFIAEVVNASTNTWQTNQKRLGKGFKGEIYRCARTAVACVDCIFLC